MLLWLASVALAAAPSGPTCAGPESHALDGRVVPMSGPEQTVEVAGFRLHWTDQGADAVVVDADSDGVPNLVEVVRDALIEGRQRFDDAGWRELVPDDGTGGSDAIDVYFVQIDANGYANPVPPADLEEAQSCYIRLDPDIAELGGDAIAGSVAVHELHHCVQFRYSAGHPSWLYEGQATLEQYRHLDDPVADLAVGVLWFKRLNEPDRPIDDTGGRFEYASFVWFKFWEEAIGPLPDLWNRLGRGADWRSALDGAVRGPGLVDLGDAFTLHAVWNAFACANDDGRHYAPEAAGCPEASLSAVDVTDVPADGVIEVDLEGAYVAEYHATVVGSGNQLAVSCTAGDDNGELGVAVVDVSSGEATFARVEAAGALRLDGPSSTVDRAALVVLTGLDESGAEARCTVFEVEEPPRRSGGMQACSTSASSAAWAWLLLVPLVWRRRR